jgi:phospholipase C
MVKVRVSHPLRVSRFRSMLSLIAIVMICSPFLLVAGCGSTGSGSAGAGTTAATVTVTASPTTVAAGGSSTLTVTATNATGVTVTGSDGSSKTVTPTGGTITVSPAATTTYTATATGAAGTTPATATATVTVTAAPPPAAPTVTLTASPASINLGSSTTLTVVATNATSLVLQGTDGTAFSSPANFPATGGTETVSPTKNATYTVTATGPEGTATASVAVTVIQPPTPTVTIAANPQSISLGNSSLLTVAATNATSVTIKGTDGSTYSLPIAGGTQSVTPTVSTTYTVTADGDAGTTPVTASATVTVVPPGTLASINHVIFMLQENHTFDNYFGMLNPYRASNGWDKGTDGTPYSVDGIDDKWNTSYLAGPGVGVARTISNNDAQGTAHTLYPLKSTCIDDETSAWAESYGDVNLGDYTVGRPMLENGFVSNEVGYTNFKCGGASLAPCTGFTDTTGDRAMGYYDQGFLNYYYYMASQFAVSDRWFSPVSDKSIPNRIATFTGGTTQGLTRDPGDEDHLTQLQIPTIFQALDKAPHGPVSWKVYYTVNNGECDPEDCPKVLSGSALYPATTFSALGYSFNFLYANAKTPDPTGCTAPASPSSVIGDSSNAFCIDLNKIAPLKDPTYGYFADLKNGTLPSFAFIESGSGLNDEHPGYQQSILAGQYQVSTIMNALMSSTSWKDSVFFFGYDEGGGPYDHVPPVPTHTNDWTDSSAVVSYPTDISTISVNADAYNPCVPAAPGDLHCDLMAGDPGTTPTDDPAVNGFGAQLGFRIPNMVVSPFTKMHYVSHVPMDHTAIIKFVENRFIDNDPTGQGPSHLTARDAAQPNLLDFFDFTGAPWATPPTPPAPVTQSTPPGQGSCQPAAFH